MTSDLLATVDDDATRFLRVVRKELARQLPALPGRWTLHAGVDYLRSDDERARRLAVRGGHFDWLALACEPFSMWDLHVGVVVQDGIVRVGVHAHRDCFPDPPGAIARLARAAGAVYSFEPRSDEHQFSLPPVSTSEASPVELADDAARLARAVGAVLPDVAPRGGVAGD